MSRNRRRPGVIRITCTDPFHRDEPGFAEQGHRHVGTLRPVQGGYAWHARPGMPADPAPAGGNSVDWGRQLGPLKNYRAGDMTEVWRIRCTCGRDVQRGIPEIAAIAARLMAARPGRRAEIDLVRLR